MVAKLILVAFGFSSWLYTCKQSPNPVSKADPESPDTVSTTKVDFAKDIQPIFLAHCAPCHFTGGKMYASMPFDKPKTIIDHQDGILRRIKGEDEVKKLKAFLVTKE